MIKITSINKSYNKRVILNDITYTFESPGLYIITGFNGCGKTTLLNMLSSLDFDYEGEIKINNVNIKKLSQEKKNKFRKDYISYVLPKGNLISFLTLRENLLLDINYEICFLDNIDLNKYPFQISGGQKILVSLAKAFSNNKNIILLDESSAQLDDKYTEILLKTIEKYKQNKLIIFVTHDSRIIKKYPSNIIKIDGGKIYDRY